VPSDPAVGTMFGEGRSLVGNFSAYDRRVPFMPPSPLRFTSGEELNVTIGVGQSTSAGSIAKEYSELGFIMRVIRE